VCGFAQSAFSLSWRRLYYYDLPSELEPSWQVQRSASKDKLAPDAGQLIGRGDRKNALQLYSGFFGAEPNIQPLL
jgi:hypothetical protein